MKIVMTATEFEPLTRATGLGEMVGELSRALSERGHDVTVVLPYYQGPDHQDIPVVDSGLRLTVPVGDRSLTAAVGGLRRKGGVQVVLLGNQELFNRPGVYGNEYGSFVDNAERFVFLSRCAIEYCRQMSIRPDVFHGFDWPAALQPSYVRLLRREGMFETSGTLFTIFDIRRQGIFERHQLHVTGLDPLTFAPDAVQYFGKINFMQAGIATADALSTMSQTFSNEICSDEFGVGLDEALHARRGDLYGVLNGVNYSVWNPARDRYLKANFTIDEMVGKRSCKVDLQTEFDLPRDVEAPVMAILPPCADSRGTDLFASVVKKVMDLGVQIVLMGDGQKKYSDAFMRLACENPSLLGYRRDSSAILEHKLLAGADMVVLPFRYAPACSDPLKAMRYGCIPVVRATGSLDDATEPFDLVAETGTSFKFREAEPQELFAQIRQAIEIYRKGRAQWRVLVANAMRKDFSWVRTAESYEKLYQAIPEIRAGKKRAATGKSRRSGFLEARAS